jgi:hypothetical protein
MSNESKTIGTKEWKEASKSWQIYAYNPASRGTTQADAVSSRTRTKEEPVFTQDVFLSALMKTSSRVSEPESEKKQTSD